MVYLMRVLLIAIGGSFWQHICLTLHMLGKPKASLDRVGPGRLSLRAGRPPLEGENCPQSTAFGRDGEDR